MDPYALGSMMQNISSAKLNMIIELFDDDLVDATTTLDASHDDTAENHDSEKAPNTGDTKGTDLPFDPRGLTNHDMEGMQ